MIWVYRKGGKVMKKQTYMQNQQVPMRDNKIIFDIVESEKRITLKELLLMTSWDEDYFAAVISSCKRRGYIEVNRGVVTQGYRDLYAAPRRKKYDEYRNVVRAKEGAYKPRRKGRAVKVDYTGMNAFSKNPERIVVE